MAENGHAVDDIGRCCNQLGVRAEIGVLFENGEHAFGIGGLGQFLTIETDNSGGSKHARRIDEATAGVYLAMKFEILFRRKYFTRRKLDERTLGRLHG